MISPKLSILAFLFFVFSIQAALCNTLNVSVDSADTVKIGLLIQDNKSRGARDGASMAIIRANKESASY